ncbi:unnamed protein product, partial [Rotaria sp. Silwood2]
RNEILKVSLMIIYIVKYSQMTPE